MTSRESFIVIIMSIILGAGLAGYSIYSDNIKAQYGLEECLKDPYDSRTTLWVKDCSSYYKAYKNLNHERY